MALHQARLRCSRCGSVHDQKAFVFELETNGSVRDGFGKAASCIQNKKGRMHAHTVSFRQNVEGS